MSLKNFFMSHERPNGSGNEWEQKDPAYYNALERIAAKTNGLVTPANLVSILGGLTTLGGIFMYAKGDPTSGLMMTAGGRSADLFDGIIATATRTRSTAGALIDAATDKVVSVAALGAFTYTGDMPAFMTAGVITTQAGIVYENSRINARGGKPTPNWAGKIATAGLWVGGAAYMSASALREHGANEYVSFGVEATGHAAMLGAIALGGIATAEYHQEANSLPGTQQKAE